MLLLPLLLLLLPMMSFLLLTFFKPKFIRFRKHYTHARTITESVTRINFVLLTFIDDNDDDDKISLVNAKCYVDARSIQMT